jgi:glyoxylase-like metal-dependent hydrolase (beta-lactamase superfamily II)
MALTGDALFTMGCGRVFTGDFARMQAAKDLGNRGRAENPMGITRWCPIVR